MVSDRLGCTYSAADAIGWRSNSLPGLPERGAETQHVIWQGVSVYTGRMKFVFASDSFKGTLSSAHICGLLEQAARESHPAAECISLRIADGGEGTLDAIAGARSGERIKVGSHDGLMRPVECEVFVSGDSAFVEAAQPCGLAMLAANERNPMATSSFGVGECIAHVLEMGCDHVTIGLGGSCTNDGGMGCLRALGVRFLDRQGCELAGRGGDMAHVTGIDTSGLHPRVADVRFSIMGDVRNPLLGPNGATYVFGSQKGADTSMLEQLESGMRAYADAVSHALGDAACSSVPAGRIDFSTPGYGAAGGLGMALAAFLNAEMSSGIETLLQWVDFDELIADADLVVTGEGRLDSQSLEGKVIDGIAAHANRLGVPVAAICGSIALADVQLKSVGLAAALETSHGLPIEYAIAHAEETYLRTARHLFTTVYSSITSPAAI